MRPLVLASQSPIRAQLLRQAGLAFEITAAAVDETGLKAEQLRQGLGPAAIARSLAEAKAANASARHAGLIIGADQTLELEGKLFDKPSSAAEAEAQLKALRGRRHQLHAATALAENGAVIWSELQSASLTMRDFSDGYLRGYMDRNAEAVLACVGAYQLEGEGVQLFDHIDGDYFAILGLPMLGLLAELRRRGISTP